MAAQEGTWQQLQGMEERLGGRLQANEQDQAMEEIRQSIVGLRETLRDLAASLNKANGWSQETDRRVWFFKTQQEWVESE